MTSARCASNTQRFVDHKELLFVERSLHAQAPPFVIRWQDDAPLVRDAIWRDEVAPTLRQLPLRQQQALLHIGDGVHFQRWKHCRRLVLVAKAGRELDVDHAGRLNRTRPDTFQDHLAGAAICRYELVLHEISTTAGVQQDCASRKCFPIEQTAQGMLLLLALLLLGDQSWQFRCILVGIQDRRCHW